MTKKRKYKTNNEKNSAAAAKKARRPSEESSLEPPTDKENEILEFIARMDLGLDETKHLCNVLRHRYARAYKKNEEVERKNLVKETYNRLEILTSRVDAVHEKLNILLPDKDKPQTETDGNLEIRQREEESFEGDRPPKDNAYDGLSPLSVEGFDHLDFNYPQWLMLESGPNMAPDNTTLCLDAEASTSTAIQNAGELMPMLQRQIDDLNHKFEAQEIKRKEDMEELKSCLFGRLGVSKTNL